MTQRGSLRVPYRELKNVMGAFVVLLIFAYGIVRLLFALLALGYDPTFSQQLTHCIGERQDDKRDDDH